MLTRARVQNNEAEALRSWKNALDQIYYHNAYRLPANYKPKTETEKALLDALRQMELQCKERVDLLEALKQSRDEASDKAGGSNIDGNTLSLNSSIEQGRRSEDGWLGDGTIPPIDYPNLARPPLPKRPSLPSPRPSSSSTARSKVAAKQASRLDPNPSSSLTVPEKVKSRTPSPEKKHGMLKTLRTGRKSGGESSSKATKTSKPQPPAASKAATQAWVAGLPTPTGESERSGSLSASAARSSILALSQRSPTLQDSNGRTVSNMTSDDDSTSMRRVSSDNERLAGFASARKARDPYPSQGFISGRSSNPQANRLSRPVSMTSENQSALHAASGPTSPSPLRQPKLHPPALAYRKEYNEPSAGERVDQDRAVDTARRLHGLSKKTEHSEETPGRSNPNVIRRKAVNHTPAASTTFSRTPRQSHRNSASDELSSSSLEPAPINPLPIRGHGKRRSRTDHARQTASDLSDDNQDHATDDDDNDTHKNSRAKDDKERETKELMRRLPKGVDESAARQVLNEVVTHGDEVHWNDIAGLEPAKNALKETVVYPFLRPDLFSGLREPARGMLLFGPPGTGKTMLARAVATESKSTFFAISASSLVSKWLGESEKLVRALFALARVLAPSIIFVDEIDSLLGSRGGSSEHEATRRVKTEFLIQWSNLQRAAAGKDSKEGGDATRVLVLAATNLPWEIDEAARRRFVRRQYIPLPEDGVREKQIRTLLSHQKHDLIDIDIKRLVALTHGTLIATGSPSRVILQVCVSDEACMFMRTTADNGVTGFSGSDITALAKDAAMGPLRSLGEKLLEMNFEDIRPISSRDFEASLTTIRPSVSKEGLLKFEEWAQAYGERAG